MHLCTFSRSEILYRDILPTCPLALSATEAKHCPAKKRLYNVPPADLRVISCQYPNDYRGEPIRDDLRVKQSIQAKLEKSKPAKPPKEKKMTTPEAQPAKPATALVPTNGLPKTGIAIYDKMRDPLDYINKIGQTFYNSKMFGCQNVDQGRVLALEFAITRTIPSNWKARHHIIGGSVSPSSESLLADFRQKVGGKHRILSYTPELASVELQHGREKHIFSFSLEEALLEDYLYTKEAVADPKLRRLPNGQLNPAAFKDNWKTPRRRKIMLMWRAVSEGVSLMAPEVSAGQVTVEELNVLWSEVDQALVEPTIGEEEAEDAEYEVKQPNNAAVSPDGAAAATGSPTPAPSGVTDSPATTTQLQVDPSTPDGEKLAMLKELSGLKKQLLTDEQYKQVIAKRGVASAKELDLPQLAHLVDALKVRLAKKQAAEGTDEVSQWANMATSRGAATAGN
jgi:hypothetical protein